MFTNISLANTRHTANLNTGQGRTLSTCRPWRGVAVYTTTGSEKLRPVMWATRMRFIRSLSKCLLRVYSVPGIGGFWGQSSEQDRLGSSLCNLHCSGGKIQERALSIINY